MSASTKLELLDPLAECDGSKLSAPAELSRVKVETGKLEGKTGCVLARAITGAAPTASPGPAVRPSPSGTARHMGAFFFDPEGADFTAWLNQARNELYRNWIVPQPALMGFRGHADVEFTVERDGSVTNLNVLKSAGHPALDRAAQNALLKSRLLPLPPEFHPPSVRMAVSFRYNEAPPQP